MDQYYSIILKEALAYCKQAAIEVHAKWDAGGDECLCSVFFKKEDPSFEASIFHNYQHVDVPTQLVNCIIEVPSAGEFFDKGEGQIGLNDDGSVYINCTGSTYNWGGDVFYDEEQEAWVEVTAQLQNNALTYTIPLEDPLQLRELLHRVEVHFEGRANRKKQIESEVILHIQQGDALTFSEAQLQVYENQMQEVLLKGLAEFEQREQAQLTHQKYPLFESVDLAGRLTHHPNVIFELQASTEDFESYHQKKVILIP
ncbi:MAG: hypothetical protein ACFB0B_09290 [Thermonemataceae bacterium]